MESVGYDFYLRFIYCCGFDSDIYDMDCVCYVDLRFFGGYGLKNKFNFFVMEEFVMRECENLFVFEGVWVIDGGNGVLRRRSVLYKGVGVSEENIY